MPRVNVGPPRALWFPPYSLPSCGCQMGTWVRSPAGEAGLRQTHPELNLSHTDLQDLEAIGEARDAELGKIRAETMKRGFRCRNQTPMQGPMLYAKSLATSCATQRPLTALREWLDGGCLKSRFIALCKRRRLHWLSWFPMGSWRRYRPPALLRFFGWNQNDWRMQSAFWPGKVGRGARKSHD